MDKLNNFVKVTQSQYNNLVSGGTVSGKSYDPNSIYLVDNYNATTSDIVSLATFSVSQNTSFSSYTLSGSILNYAALLITIENSTLSDPLFIPVILLKNTTMCSASYPFQIKAHTSGTDPVVTFYFNKSAPTSVYTRGCVNKTTSMQIWGIKRQAL